MVIWWITEALPMPVVALLPIFLFPVLGINSIEETVRPYADKVIFLFMGGFMLGIAIEKWSLHKRIALNIVKITGTSGDRIILGFILATGLISMWLSNTATTMMMFPIALSVIHVLAEGRDKDRGVANFSLTLMLAIAYASNFGGISTIIGTPPNVAYVGFFESKYGKNIDFFQWMTIAFPVALILLLSLYLVMVKWLYPNKIRSDAATKMLIQSEIAALGPMNVNEKRVLGVFMITASLWMLKDIINSVQPLFRLDDSNIAIFGAILLFLIPARSETSSNLLIWEDTRKMAWGILILFGGGMTLAAALEKAGLIQDLGDWLAQFSNNPLLLVFCIALVSLFISELMSNIAQVIVFAPVVSALADSTGINPLLLGIPMTLAASCACMLPMGTPPNAIVFSSGFINLKHMTKIGLVMNIVAVVVITVLCWVMLKHL